MFFHHVTGSDSLLGRWQTHLHLVMETGWEATEVPPGSEHRAQSSKVLSPSNKVSPQHRLACFFIHGWPHPFAKNMCLAPKEQDLSPVITGGQSQSEGCLWPFPAQG